MGIPNGLTFNKDNSYKLFEVILYTVPTIIFPRFIYKHTTHTFIQIYNKLLTVNGK